MSQQYASQQPAGFKNHVETIAIIGAGGNIGSYIAKALIAAGKHKITALTRPDSTSVLPDGLHDIKKIVYDDNPSLVSALQGQDALIIIMGVTADRQHTLNLFEAAAKAGVKYLMPNEWGTDISNERLANDIRIGARAQETRKKLSELDGDKMHWISLNCGFWYEFSLAGTEVRYGFDFPNRKLTFYDDGNLKINTSTWPQCGRAVARLLSLPIYPEQAGDKGPFLSEWNNKPAYIQSFFVSQRDMLASVLRVTGTKESDWEISHEDVKERFKRGEEEFARGEMVGFGRLLYARIFFPEDDSNFSDKLENEKLGLPQEDLDGFTKIAVERALASGPEWSHR